jgi:ParB-like nuclease domain
VKIIAQEYRQADPRTLRPHPRNPRQGDVGAIHQSIAANGFYGAIIVQRSTQHVLAGNHRLQAALHADARTVPVLEVDCDDATALRILLADNRTNDLASYDYGILGELLRESALQGQLEGTGFDGADVDALIEYAALDPLPDPEASRATRCCPNCGWDLAKTA